MFYSVPMVHKMLEQAPLKTHMTRNFIFVIICMSEIKTTAAGAPRSVFNPFCSVGWLSGQKQRSVKPSGYALHRFESYPYQSLKPSFWGGFLLNLSAQAHRPNPAEKSPRKQQKAYVLLCRQTETPLLRGFCYRHTVKNLSHGLKPFLSFKMKTAVFFPFWKFDRKNPGDFFLGFR